MGELSAGMCHPALLLGVFWFLNVMICDDTSFAYTILGKSAEKIFMRFSLVGLGCFCYYWGVVAMRKHLYSLVSKCLYSRLS